MSQSSSRVDPARPPDLALLLGCARTRLDAARASRAATLCGEIGDWDALIDRARAHGLDPLLHRHLGGLDAVPLAARARLRGHAETTAVRNRLLAVELGKVLAALAAHGVGAMPYKGPVLASAAYGDVALRRFADLDVLVRRADARPAVDALRGLGYAPRLALTPAQERAYLRAECEYALDRDRGRFTVEVHWDVAPRDYAVRVDLDAIWRAARPIDAAGLPVLSPAPEDLLLLLIVHGSKHAWERLSWLVDVAELTRAHPDLPWDRLIARARTAGAGRMLRVALALARELLGADLPPVAARAVDADGRALALARQIGGAVCAGALPVPRSLAAVRLQRALRERARDRLAYLARLALTPTIDDWASVRLPAAALPLHYVLRPLRLAAKHGAAALRRAR